MDERNSAPERNDPMAHPVGPTDVNQPTTIGAPEGGTPVLREAETEPYGLEVANGDVVQSDLVGLAELSSEYSMDHALADTKAEPDAVREAWRQAADDSLESPLEMPRDR